MINPMPASRAQIHSAPIVTRIKACTRLAMRQPDCITIEIAAKSSLVPLHGAPPSAKMIAVY